MTWHESPDLLDPNIINIYESNSGVKLGHVEIISETKFKAKSTTGREAIFSHLSLAKCFVGSGCTLKHRTSKIEAKKALKQQLNLF